MVLELCCIFSLGSSLSPSKIVYSSVNINVPVQIQKVLWKFDYKTRSLVGLVGTLKLNLSSLVPLPVKIIQLYEQTRGQ